MQPVARARLILDRACGIDRAARRIALEGRAPLAYDLASINIGITSDLPALAGFSEHGVAAKPLDRFAASWERWLRETGAEGAGAGRKVVVIGAGVGGVELALAMAERCAAEGPPAEITLVERAARALPGIGTGARAALLAHLAARGIAVITGCGVARLEHGAVLLEDGRRIGSDFTLSAAGARPQGWLGGTGLTLREGFVAVGPTLQSIDDPAILDEIGSALQGRGVGG